MLWGTPSLDTALTRVHGESVIVGVLLFAGHHQHLLFSDLGLNVSLVGVWWARALMTLKEHFRPQTGCTDLLTLTVFFHALMGAA